MPGQLARTRLSERPKRGLPLNIARCPKCNAELPAKGRFCLECGCDLYRAGVRRPPIPWAKALVALAGVLGLLALVLLAAPSRVLTRSAELPPEERAVRGLTRELLQLAADGRFSDLVRRFCQPNAEEFRRIGELHQEIVRGRGAPGLSLFRASCTDDIEEARKLVDRLGTEHPAYVVGVLAALTFQDGALRATLGGAPLGAQRAEDFCAWHLATAFRGVDTKRAEITGVQWRDGPDGQRLLAVAIRYPEPPKLIPGILDPTALSWRLTPDGGWALSFGNALLLDEVLAFLLKMKL